jgi:hypothetical protein
MKKTLIVFFFTGFTALLYAQAPNSAAVQAELQQLNKIRDSLNRAQLEKEGVSIPTDPGNEQEVPSEMQANFDRIIKLQENEQRVFSKKMLLITALIFILIAGMRIIINKQKQKN